MTREQARSALEEFARRVGVVLEPLGFTFEVEEVGFGHTSYASGGFRRGSLRVGLFCRSDGRIEEPAYKWGRHTTGHRSLMFAMGHGDERLFDPRAHHARDGADSAESLIHDLELLAPVLRLDLDAQSAPSFPDDHLEIASGDSIRGFHVRVRHVPTGFEVIRDPVPEESAQLEIEDALQELWTDLRSNDQRQ